MSGKWRQNRTMRFLQEMQQDPPTAKQMEQVANETRDYLIYLDLLLMDGKYWTGEIDIGHRICPVRKSKN